MNLFSMLYRVFYDKKLAVEFIKNGTGRGGKVLFVLAVFVALTLSARGFLTVNALKELPVSEMTKNMPEIVFQDYKIVAPENYYAAFSDEQKTVSFVFDTSDAFVPPAGRGVYMSKDALIIQDTGETRIIPYQKMLTVKDLTVSREAMTAFVQRLIDAVRTFLPPIMFVVIAPVLFAWYILLSYFYGTMSYLMTYALRRELEYDERIRLSVLSLMPWMVLNALAALLDVNIRFGLASGVLLTLIYMFCFLKEEKDVKTV